jgi:AcrR family transcriptional regulator
MAQTAEQTGTVARSVPRTARERARAEITREILDAGRRHLATDGAAALSLRAIARDMGMASSAVYRYVASRDDLLTRLIIDAYDSLGSAAESADAGIDRRDLARRWGAICRAVRGWALANPNEWALIYGSPVPGYAAPADTIPLVQILAEAAERGIVPPDPAGRDLTPAGKSALSPVLAVVPPAVTAAALQAGLMVWSALLGTISLELFGQFHNVISEDPADRDVFFSACVERWAAQIGIA